MIVHFIGSRSKIAGEIDYYRRIVKYIKDQGHTISNDWIEDAYELVHGGHLKKQDESWAEVDERNSEAISQADVVVVECTQKSFFAGYRVAQAAIQKKPLLMLTRDKSPVAVSGLSTPSGFVKSVTYDDSTLEPILHDFLAENTIGGKDLRFNFVIDRQTYNYLRWEASKTGKTKAQIIRALLREEMDKNN